MTPAGRTAPKDRCEVNDRFIQGRFVSQLWCVHLLERSDASHLKTQIQEAAKDGSERGTIVCNHTRPSGGSRTQRGAPALKPWKWSSVHSTGNFLFWEAGGQKNPREKTGQTRKTGKAGNPSSRERQKQPLRFPSRPR